MNVAIVNRVKYAELENLIFLLNRAISKSKIYYSSTIYVVKNYLISKLFPITFTFLLLLLGTTTVAPFFYGTFLPTHFHTLRRFSLPLLSIIMTN